MSRFLKTCIMSLFFVVAIIFSSYAEYVKFEMKFERLDPFMGTGFTKQLKSIINESALHSTLGDKIETKLHIDNMQDQNEVGRSIEANVLTKNLVDSDFKKFLDIIGAKSVYVSLFNNKDGMAIVLYKKSYANLMQSLEDSELSDWVSQFENVQVKDGKKALKLVFSVKKVDELKIFNFDELIRVM